MVISKILIELEKRFKTIEAGNLKKCQLFNKGLYKNCSELQLSKF